MSALIQLSTEVSTQMLTAHQVAALPAAGGDGILDWVTTKNTETQSVLRALAVTLGIIFVILQAVASRGAMARILISLIAAGVFIWGVWNVTDIKDRVDNEVAIGPVAAQLAPNVATTLTVLVIPTTT